MTPRQPCLQALGWLISLVTFLGAFDMSVYWGTKIETQILPLALFPFLWHKVTASPIKLHGFGSDHSRTRARRELNYLFSSLHSCSHWLMWTGGSTKALNLEGSFTYTSLSFTSFCSSTAISKAKLHPSSGCLPPSSSKGKHSWQQYLSPGEGFLPGPWPCRPGGGH